MISVTRIFRLGVRFASWVTPYMKEWHRQRHMNRSEAARHMAARNWSEAEKHLTLALSERRHANTQRLDLLLALKEAQRKQGKSAEAERTVLQAVDLAAAAQSTGLQSRALDALADVQLDQKKYADVEDTVTRIEKLERSFAEPDFKRIASSKRKLGTALLHGGHPAEAMKAFEQGADLSEKVFGPEHPETADSFVELGALYREQGNHAEAQRCFRRALQIHRTVCGADSHQATADLAQLASSLEESGDIVGAATEYERVLSLKERQIGGDREKTAETQAHLAAIYLRTGRTSAARELLTHALGVLERNNGDERLEFALETMASLQERLNGAQDAQPWRDKVAASAAIRTGRHPGRAVGKPPSC